MAATGNISRMTPRERLLAAFRRQQCDHVPFAPLLDGYFQASLPDGKRRRVEDIQFDLAGHVFTRAYVLQLNTPLWIGAPTADLPPGVTERYFPHDGDVLHTVETPVGILTWRFRFAPETPFIPWIVEHRIRTLEDVKTFQYLVERTRFQLWTEYLSRQQADVGERGVVAILGPSSPLQQMINFDIGLEQTVYMLADHPAEMNEMLDAFHAKQVEMWKAMAELPAEVYFIHDNLSSTTTSRAMYRGYDRRYVNEYADIAHATGKKLITHWCGKLSGFAEDIAEARQDGISDVTPPPTGDLNIAEARKTWARRFVLMGGIDPTLFAQGTATQVEAYAEDLLQRLAPDRRGFVLGSGDAVPFGTPPENVRAAARVATRFAVG